MDHPVEVEDVLKEHADRFALEYQKLQPFYADLASVVARIVRESLTSRNIKVHSVQDRAKGHASFAQKAGQPSDEDPSRPKYDDPLKQVTDLAGVRVITHFLSTLKDVDNLIEAEFEVLEKSNKGTILIETDRFGYQSVHYLVRIKADRAKLPEYGRFAGHVAEIQVRTILQHAWAEIEHDIQYKSSKVIPTEIRRRFVALAGMLEIADREFQAISSANEKLESTAEANVKAGNLNSVEITPRALKAFLDKRLGPDGRMKDFSYEWEARLLRSLGFQHLAELEAAIEPYDDHELSILVEGSRMGQITRFEHMLAAALGEQWIERHPWQTEFWQDFRRKHLDRLRAAEVPIGSYQLQGPRKPF